MRAIAVVGIVAKEPGGELDEVGLARAGGTEFAEAPDHGAVLRRLAAGLVEKRGAGFRRYARQVIQILQQVRDAVEGLFCRRGFTPRWFAIFDCKIGA